MTKLESCIQAMSGNVRKKLYKTQCIKLNVKTNVFLSQLVISSDGHKHVFIIF